MLQWRKKEKIASHVSALNNTVLQSYTDIAFFSALSKSYYIVWWRVLRRDVAGGRRRSSGRPRAGNYSATVSTGTCRASGGGQPCARKRDVSRLQPAGDQSGRVQHGNVYLDLGHRVLPVPLLVPIAIAHPLYTIHRYLAAYCKIWKLVGSNKYYAYGQYLVVYLLVHIRVCAVCS